MGARVRCPHCEESFRPDPSAAGAVCPFCGERVGPAPGAAPASAPPAGNAPGTAKKFAIQKTCPACGYAYSADERLCPGCGASYTRARLSRAAEDEEEGIVPVKAGIRKGVMGGVIMILIAAVWFFVGLAAGRIFVYPPILAVIGIYSLIKGLASGNYAGEKPQIRRRPR